MSHSQLYDNLMSCLASSADGYEQMNRLRDWVNQNYPDFDFFLEDVWNEYVEGETHIEYQLRSKKTLNMTSVFAADIYTNRQDAGGVWHLGDYQRTDKHFGDEAIAAEIAEFIEANQG